MHIYVKNMLKYKDLFIELIIKDIKLKYRNSILGIFWSMINPLLMMVVFSIIFMALFKNEIPNFPLYVLIGRIIYQFFSESTNFAMDSVQSNAELIRKVYVPKYYFPLSRICSTFITSIAGFVPVALVMLISGIPFRGVNLLFVVPLFYLLIISAGIGMFLSAINVFFRDIKHFYSIVMLVLMYMTPIFYPISIIPENFLPLIMMNPLFPIVELFRDIVMQGVVSDPLYHGMSLVNMLLYGCIGLFTFYKLQDRFIYHL